MGTLARPDYWLSRFAKMRARLYWLTMAFYALVVCLLSSAAILDGAVESSMNWPVELERFLVPDFPANLVEIALTHPVPSLLLVAIAVLIFWMSRSVRIEEGECTFRSWASHQSDPPKCPLRDWKPELLARAIARIGPVFPLLAVILAIVSLGLLGAAIHLALTSSSAEAAFSGSTGGGECAEPASPCESPRFGIRLSNAGPDPEYCPPRTIAGRHGVEGEGVRRSSSSCCRPEPSGTAPSSAAQKKSGSTGSSRLSSAAPLPAHALVARCSPDGRPSRTSSPTRPICCPSPVAPSGGPPSGPGPCPAPLRLAIDRSSD